MAAKFILITETADTTFRDLLNNVFIGLGYIAEPHRIWILFCTSAFLEILRCAVSVVQ